MRKTRESDKVKTITETVIVPVRVEVTYAPSVPFAKADAYQQINPFQERFGYSLEYGYSAVKTLGVLYDKITVEKPKKSRK